jgi:hypothetical protein
MSCANSGVAGGTFIVPLSQSNTSSGVFPAMSGRLQNQLDALVDGRQRYGSPLVNRFVDTATITSNTSL